MNTSKIFILSMILLVIGGLNWGLVGLFNFNLVSTIFGETTILSRIIYCLVGISAVSAVITMPKNN